MKKFYSRENTSILIFHICAPMEGDQARNAGHTLPMSSSEEDEDMLLREDERELQAERAYQYSWDVYYDLMEAPGLDFSFNQLINFNGCCIKN